MKIHYLAPILILLLTASACAPLPTACTEEAKICPDGTAVGRSGPNCEFDPCPGEVKSSGSQELKSFTSREQLIAFLEENQQEQNYGYARGFGMEFMAMDMAVAESAPTATPMAAKASGATDVSQTNVQVQGVDEADFVKNDNKYIYLLQGDEFVIIDAFPAEDAEILSETDIDGNPSQLFINNNRAVIFTQENEQQLFFPLYDILPRPRYTTVTHALIYDISNRKDPELLHDIEMKGNYFQSRMIDEHIYFIVKENLYYQHDYVDVPVIRAEGRMIAQPEIFYFDNPENNYVFHTIASLNINGDESDVEAKSFLMGYSNNLYVSQENIYISYQKQRPYRQLDQRDRFFDVVVPLLPAKVGREIEAIRKTKMAEYAQWDQIIEIFENMYNDMNEAEKEDLVERIEEAVNEYEIKREQEFQQSVIHKIAIDDGKIDYVTRGEVPGSLLNQFSLDEHQGNLRVATTTSFWTRLESVMYNNVYVLDEELEIIGEIEEIAPDERIYSARFIGDRLYMVTFQRIDPFFVIDLSNPRNPEILGELKIPGFSDYLHPFDENHIIGIGKETKENEWGGISTQGVKIALFDVSNVAKPKQVDMLEIGAAGSDSEALREHKAFLFDKERELLVIPVREVKSDRRYDRGYYWHNIWQGAYVLSINEQGIERRGKIAHYEGDEEDRWYWGSPHAVRRSLFMDDVLYTISKEMVKMNDLDTLERVNEIDLPEAEEHYPIYY